MRWTSRNGVAGPDSQSAIRDPRAAWRCGALLLGFALALLVWSAPALALSQQGHEFASSFGSGGSSGGHFKSPSGVAVNETSGDIYVVDRGNNRVERFASNGEFKEAWGWGVATGAAAFERCTSTCKTGLAGSGAAQFNSPEAIAVDNSASSPSKGDVYVLSDTVSLHNVIEKFSAAGESLGRLKTEAAGSLGGVAVDASGLVYSYEDEETRITIFSAAVENALLSTVAIGGSTEFCGQPGFAVDATGAAFYADHVHSGFEGCPTPSAKNPIRAAKIQANGEPLLEALDGEATSAIAVDLSTGQQSSADVYIDNVTSVAAFDSSGSLVQSFATEAELGGEASLKKGTGIGVNAKTGAVYVADGGRSRIDVFTPRAPGPPEIDSLSAQDLSTTSTRLEAAIDPHGATTMYFFEYGPLGCSGEGTCTKTTPATIPAGFGDQGVNVVATGLQPGTTYEYRVVATNPTEATGKSTFQTFTTLPSSAGILADQRAWEQVSPPEKLGASIEPLGAAVGGLGGGIIESSEDGASVTYAATAPVEAGAEGNRAPEGLQVISARGSQAWSSHDIITPHTRGEGVGPGEAQEYRSFSRDLAYGLVEPLPFGFTNPLQEPPLAGDAPEERGLYRRNNATCPATCYQALVSSEDNTGVEEGHPSHFGGLLDFVSAAPDLGHVVLRSQVPLTPFPVSEEGDLYEWTAGSPASLQLINVLPGAHPKRAERAELGHDKQGVTDNARRAISDDGSRAFWVQLDETSGLASHLYMRDTADGKTVHVNAAETGVHETNGEEAEELNEVRFQIASSDGKRVFFTDTVPLTHESTLELTEKGPSDLYVCELAVVTEENCKANLKDLTVDPHFGEPAEVIGSVTGASDTGSTVYFVANGRLTPDAKHRGQCKRPNGEVEPPPGATCNLYVERFNEAEHKWEAPKLIAELSADDAPDWAKGGDQLWNLAARVSPNGTYLAFMSDRSLTGYNNLDRNSGKPDEEVFLYTAQTETEAESLLCASCNPANTQPEGVFDTKQSGEGLGLVVDPHAEVWPDRWLAASIPALTPLDSATNPYQSRYLLDDGRLFFNSADALVGQDTNHRQEQVGAEKVPVGVSDVYEYERQGVGSCQGEAGCVSLLSSGTSTRESSFLDASVSGNDAFFLTNQPLVAADGDTIYDVYDAHVCSEAAPCFPPPPSPPPVCEAEATCRAAAPGQAGIESPRSILGGPGNIPHEETIPTGKPPPKRLTKLEKALKSCRKKYKHSKHKRKACERKARKADKARRAATHRGGGR